MIKIENSSDCCGCGACAQGCPKQCISMVSDKEGFLYPKVNEAICINCNLCEKVCPMFVCNDDKLLKETYGCSSLDSSIKENSSSGGIFTELANYIIDSQGIICGASYDTNMHVSHICIDKIEDLPKLQKSKYVQSEMCNCYSDIKRYLTQGKRVLFVGTPCQVAGLVTFLGIKYNNLFTVDLICSGVPSPMVWNDYVKEIQKSNHSCIEHVDFRDKKMGWKKSGFSVKFSSKPEYMIQYNKESYVKAFILKLINRPSCYKCKFICENHFSDMTIGDFWGVENFNIENDNTGISLVVCNTEKGKEIISRVNKKIQIEKVDYNKAITMNWPLYKNAKPHIHRKKFFRNYMDENLKEQIEMNLKYNVFERILIKLKLYNEE